MVLVPLTPSLSEVHLEMELLGHRLCASPSGQCLYPVAKVKGLHDVASSSTLNILLQPDRYDHHCVEKNKRYYFY